MPNVFGIANKNLIAGFDEQGKDNNETLEKVLQVCRQTNSKLNKDKCLFRCTSIPFFGKVISLKDMPGPQGKFQHLLICHQKGIVVIPVYMKVPKEVLISNHRGM